MCDIARDVLIWDGCQAASDRHLVSEPSPVADQGCPRKSLVAEDSICFERQRHQLWRTSELDALPVEVIVGNSPTLR